MQLPSTAIFVVVACLSLPAQSRPFCSSDSDCNQRGTAALNRGETDKAIQLFERQAAFAEVAEINRQQKSLAVAAYNNLALAYMQKGDYLWARAWTHVALRVDSRNSTAQSNLRRVNQARGQVLWPATPAGKYVQYAGRGAWQTIVVMPASSGKIEFCFSGLWWGGGAKGPSGTGNLRATVPLHENRAEYSSNEFGSCRISLEFSADELEATQTGSGSDCGFGHNVTASGTFERISAKAACQSR